MEGWQGRERRKGGGGVHCLFRTCFGGYFFKNLNLDGVTFFVELFYNLNTTPPPPQQVVINKQSLKYIRTRKAHKNARQWRETPAKARAWLIGPRETV